MRSFWRSGNLKCIYIKVIYPFCRKRRKQQRKNQDWVARLQYYTHLPRNKSIELSGTYICIDIHRCNVRGLWQYHHHPPAMIIHSHNKVGVKITCKVNCLRTQGLLLLTSWYTLHSQCACLSLWLLIVTPPPHFIGWYKKEIGRGEWESPCSKMLNMEDFIEEN